MEQPVNNQPTPIEIDPNIKAIFDDIEAKLSQVNMMLVLQFASNIMVSCVSQLPGVSREILPIIVSPIFNSINAAIAYSEHIKNVNAGKKPLAAAESGPPILN
jgi:hypothetical protein